MVGQAFGMVAQYLEHTAIRSLSAAALMHHPLQFRPQRLEPRQSLLDLFELPTGYSIRLRAGLSRMIAEIEELTDRVQRESQLPCVPDE